MESWDGYCHIIGIGIGDRVLIQNCAHCNVAALILTCDIEVLEMGLGVQYGMYMFSKFM